MGKGTLSGMRGDGQPRVWVLIVNWNARQELLNCLASIARSELSPARVVVVDNGSTDGSVAAVASHYPETMVIPLEENLGFARANNIGAERFLADPEATHLFLLNNDAVVAEDTLTRLLEATVRRPRIGAVAPKIYYLDDPTRLWYAGGAMDWKQGTARHRGMGQVDRGQFDAAQPVTFATGCGLLLHRAAVEEVGLFDPRYFFFAEDLDLCLRLQAAGYLVWYAPQAILWHEVGHSTGRRGGAFIYYHMTRNRLLTMHNHARWHHWLQFAAYFPLLWGWKALQALFWGELGVWRGMWRGASDFVAGRFERRVPRHVEGVDYEANL